MAQADVKILIFAFLQHRAESHRRVLQNENLVLNTATPYHSWERGSNENVNGLIRQYLPKTESMAQLTQLQCDRIADALNSRPRKRFNYKTPEEMYYGI